MFAETSAVKRSAEDRLERLRQPYLHELVTAVRAPGVALSATDGQVRGGVDGAYWADRRVLSRLVVRVDGVEPVGIRAAAELDGSARFVGVLRELGDAGADPTVTLERHRVVIEGGVRETISVISRARHAVRGVLEAEVACDLGEMAQAKSGHGAARLAGTAGPGGIVWRGADGAVVTLAASPRPARTGTDMLRWPFELDRGGRLDVEISATLAEDPRPRTVLPASGELSSAGLYVRSTDGRFPQLLRRSLADLDALTLADPLQPADRFLAAGAPWFLTLFGRDAIWAARMSLPLGTDLAAGTLRVLARRQGTKDDAETSEQPGKIMHELRPAATQHDDAAGRISLPPLYFGTVDATALWVSLLHDAWRAGLPRDEIADLLPSLVRAMEWITDHGTTDTGFVAYEDTTGRGLANQGWKDSGDSVQFRNGTLAAAPIALCEVQGYSYTAAVEAARLADSFGLDGGDAWLRWAATLRGRFRDRFWVDDADGAYPAIALDGSGRRVDSATSNIGHLLGTGLLDPDEEALVVARLGRPDLDGGYGLRTMSSLAAGFNPLAYHGGSVWTHDTAIAVLGLARSSAPGAGAVASSLVQGLLAAAPAFDLRMPELFGGHARDDAPVAVPYPAACCPQAWSATAAIAMLTVALGLDVDVPAGMLRLRPARPSPLGALQVRGLPVAGGRLDVDVAADGVADVLAAPDGLRVEVG